MRWRHATAADFIAPQVYQVGTARVEITPAYPVRLGGFGFRRAESEGVTQPIWAKALAVSESDGEPVILLAVDSGGLPTSLVSSVAQRLEAQAGVKRERLAATATHTHTAPLLSGMCPTLFGMKIPDDQQQRIDRYTAELADKMVETALAALADRKPARLEWGIGAAGFAVNRRTPGGPVDRDLPVLVARDLEGGVRAVYASYACHCVTLSNNKVSGDWAGYAQEAIERMFPNAMALVSIGCGADANPSSGVSGDHTEIAAAQGAEIAAEVSRLLQGYLAPLSGPIETSSRRLTLPLAELPARQQWEERAKAADAAGYHARVQLERLNRGQALRTAIDYPVQTWTFGDSLALLFLPGEVVADYSLRLKRELDGARLWINAYANDAPCYIPSERVLKEGGYEAGGAMVYYDLPAPLAPGLEEKIVVAVHEQLAGGVAGAGGRFGPTIDPSGTPGSRPLSPQQSLAALRVGEGLAVDLVAAEPLVADPVAIDFGADGRLWVAEMNDYPTGLDGRFQPGGRVRLLEDTDADGRFDTSTVFLDKIPFPTGVTVWRGGVLVCAAPDILYAEDTDGDRRADLVRKLFSGFGTENYQARVNSLCYGLDNWVHGSCGLFGGRISRFAGEPVELGDRDFRLRPDTGDLEPATGRTQQGRVRDDWGNWFGCDNSNLCWHYPLADDYLRRNPHVAPPDSAVNVTADADPGLLYPARSEVQRFKLSGPANRVTAACGLGVYRDELLGADYAGDVFTCEPVNLLVHRLKLSPRESTFAGRRPESDREFLCSTDEWFRPVQVRTGPDGALWVVDMYRFVIEHPRWIPPDDLAKLDVRAGHTLGRIYRVRPKVGELRTPPRLDQLDAAGLAAALDSPNGWQRDLAGQLLLWKFSKPRFAGPADARLLDEQGEMLAAVQRLEQLAQSCTRAVTRLQALCVLEGLGQLRPDLALRSLSDRHPGVRQHALRLCEGLLSASSELEAALVAMADDRDAQVRLQLACTLGECTVAKTGRALAALARQSPDDPYLTAAVLSSVRRENIGEILAAVLDEPSPMDTRGTLLARFLPLAVALGDKESLAAPFDALATHRDGHYQPWQMSALAAVLDSLEQTSGQLANLLPASAEDKVQTMLAAARRVAADSEAADDDRIAAAGVLGRQPDARESDLELLAALLVPQNAAAIQEAALAALARIPNDRVAAALAARWQGFTPALQTQSLDLLLSRETWQRQLLQSIERGEIPAAQIDAARRQVLLAHGDLQVREAAAGLFAGSLNADRQKVLAQYRDVDSLAGDTARGKALFAQRCSVCHRLGGVGHAVGPDLAALANKSPRFLLQEMLDPNKNVDSRYVQYAAATQDGRIVVGLLASETGTSITLRGQEGKEQVLLRGDVEELRSSGKSLMPEGLEKDLSKQDFADLIAFLGGSAPPRKEFAGNMPATVTLRNGVYELLATNGEIYGGEIRFEAPFKNIGYWHGLDDHVAWNLDVDRAGEFEVHLEWACDDGSAGNLFVLEGAGSPLRGQVEGTGGWDQYHRKQIGTIRLEAGQQRLILRPDGSSLRGALLDLRAVRLVPSASE